MEVPTQPYMSTDHRTGNMTYQGKEQNVVEDYTLKKLTQTTHMQQRNSLRKIKTFHPHNQRPHPIKTKQDKQQQWQNNLLDSENHNINTTLLKPWKEVPTGILIDLANGNTTPSTQVDYSNQTTGSGTWENTLSIIKSTVEEHPNRIDLITQRDTKIDNTRPQATSPTHVIEPTTFLGRASSSRQPR